MKSNEQHVREVFALVQDQTPRQDLLANKIGQPALKTLAQAFYSRFVAERILPRFLTGPDRLERLPRVTLTDAIVLREAHRLRNRFDPEFDPHTDGQSETGPDTPEPEIALSWRHAFHGFLLGLRGHRDAAFERLARQSPESEASVQEVSQAMDGLDTVDSFVASGRFAEAFLMTRRYLDAGLTCFATRHLSLAARLAESSEHLERIIGDHRKVVSKRFVEQMQKAVILRAPASEHHAEHERVVEFVGELPAFYTFRQDLDRAFFDPAAATQWAALTRPDPLLVDAPEPAARRVIMPAQSDGLIDLAETSAVMADDGIGVVLVGADIELRTLLSDHSDISFAASFTEASQRETSHSGLVSLMVCDHFAPVPSAVFEAMEQTGTQITRVDLETVVQNAGDAGLAQIAGAASRPTGLWATDPARIHNLLEKAGGQPAKAAHLALTDLDLTPGQWPMPWRLYTSAVSDLPLLETPRIELVLGSELSELEEDADRAPFRVYLPPGSTGGQVLAALRKKADADALSADVPVVFCTRDFSYDTSYGELLAARQSQYQGRPPIAVRGLEVLGDETKLAFDDGQRRMGLLRAAPLGLVCMSLDHALAFFAAVNTRPMDRAIVVFDIAAIATGDIRPYVKTHWDGVLAEIAENTEDVQAVFDAGHHNLGDKIAAQLARGQDTGLLPFEAYLRTKETAKRQLAGFQRREGERAQIASVKDLLAMNALWLLILDGRGDDVRDALLALAERPEDLLDLDAVEFKALLSLVDACGAQHAFARALFPLAPEFCKKNVFYIMALFELLSGILDRTTVIAALFASIAAAAGKEGRLKPINRLGILIAETVGPEMAVSAFRLIGRLSGTRFAELDDVHAAFGRRILPISDPGIGPDEEVMLSTALRPEDRLAVALAREDRDLTCDALAEISSRDGHLLGVIEATQLLSAELRQFELRATDWSYPAYGDPDEILAMAALLGDTDLISAFRGKGVSPEIEAVAAAAAGDPDPLNRLFADWAEIEEIAALRFGGASIAHVFDTILGTAPARYPQATPDLLVSVIMTTHNPDPDLLERAIASVLAQGWSKIELLLVDDGSDPGSRQAIHRRLPDDPRIRFFEMAQNGGPYLGRNLALKEAKGDFIAIQDADDVSHPDRFISQIAHLTTSPGALATEAKHMRFDRNGQPQFLRNMKLSDDGTMSTMYRREAFDKLGPFAPTRSRGDVEMRERIRQAFGPVAFRQTACPLVFCLGAPTTLSRTVVQNNESALKRFRTAILHRTWQMGSKGPQPLGDLPIPDGLRP